MLEPPKPAAPSFKTPNSDIDLFGLRFEETTPKSKDSSEDQEGVCVCVCVCAHVRACVCVCVVQDHYLISHWIMPYFFTVNLSVNCNNT